MIKRDALLMYHKFDYKLQKLTLITFTRWAALKKKTRQISGKLRISFRRKF